MSIFSKLGSALGRGIVRPQATPSFIPPGNAPYVPYGTGPSADDEENMGDMVDENTSPRRPSIGSTLATGERTVLPKYQEAIERRMQIQRPQEEKIGLGRKIAGLAIMGASPFAGPGVLAAQHIGERIAMGGGNLDRMRKYRQDIAASDDELGVLSKAEQDEQRRAQHEATLAATKDYRASLAEQKTAEQERKEAEGQERAFTRRITMRQAGAKPYTPPPEFEAQIPSTVPGVAPTTTTVGPPPTPIDVETDPGGAKWQIPPKAPAGTFPIDPAEAEELGLTGPLIDGKVHVPTTAYREKVKEPKEPKLDAVRLAVTAAGGDPDKPITPEVARRASGILKPSQTGGIQLTPEAVAFWAGAAAKGVPLPSLGYGSAGAKAREGILNAAPGLSSGTDLATARADYRADSESLKKMKSMRDAVIAFEKTAMANTDIFLETAKSIIDSGSPIVNTPLRAINQKVLGGPELAAYNAARRVAVNEVAKITSNPNLAGILSDSARKEVEDLVPENATLRQLYAVVSVLRRDMANRKKFFDEGIAEIQGRIRGAGAGNTGGQQGGRDQLKPIIQRSPSTGLYRHSLDGGKTWLPGQPK